MVAEQKELTISKMVDEIARITEEVRKYLAAVLMGFRFQSHTLPSSLSPLQLEALKAKESGDSGSAEKVRYSKRF